MPAGATTTHLGTGGFASTFKVVTAEGETYALKVVDAAQSGSERTDRELAALSVSSIRTLSDTSIPARSSSAESSTDGSRWFSLRVRPSGSSFAEAPPMTSGLLSSW